MSTQLCDWCDRPARRGLGPATGATHHLCNLHDAAPDLLAALKDLERTMREQLASLIDNGGVDASKTSTAFDRARDAIAKAEEGS